jgi:putative transposase
MILLFPWQWLRKQYSYIQLDEYIITPNHIHAILIINNSVGNGRDRSLPIKSLSSLIDAFKTTSSKLIHQNNLPEFKWQKSFHDHIIRKKNIK